MKYLNLLFFLILNSSYSLYAQPLIGVDHRQYEVSIKGTNISIVPFRLRIDYINDYDRYVDAQPIVDAYNMQQLEKLDSTIRKLTIFGNHLKAPISIPASIKRFSNLEELYIKGCYVDNIEAVVHLTKLKRLHFPFSWLHAKAMPQDIDKLTALSSLDVSFYAEDRTLHFPEQILKLQNLVQLNVTLLPKSSVKGLSKLKKLQSLTIDGRYSEIDSSICDLPELKELILIGDEERFTLPSNITRLNKSQIKLFTSINSQADADLLKKLDHLKYLELYLSKPAINIVLNPALIDLSIQDRTGVLPVDFTSAPALQLLEINYSDINRFPKSLVGLKDLRSLTFRHCDNLESFDDAMFNNKKLTDLRVFSCHKIKLSENARARTVR